MTTVHRMPDFATVPTVRWSKEYRRFGIGADGKSLSYIAFTGATDSLLQVSTGSG
jgi:hypothetical protein